MFNFKSGSTFFFKNETGWMHTWFCRRLDLYLLDEDMDLIKTMKFVRPFSIITLGKNVKYIYEKVV